MRWTSLFSSIYYALLTYFNTGGKRGRDEKAKAWFQGHTPTNFLSWSKSIKKSHRKGTIIHL